MAGEKIIPIGTQRTVRERILEAAGEVLARDGFEGVSMESVADAAGLERAAI